MHVLMAVAALGALLIGEYVEAGAVLFLFAVAGDLEHKTLSRARAEVRSLMDLSPVEATVLRHGHRVEMPVSEVRRGEIVLVRPGERVPVDGTVSSGSSAVDASAITGESLPEPKFLGDRVYAGSVNGSGALEIVCEQTAADSAIGRVLKSIERARSEKSPTEAFVDQFARVYTPLVIVGALIVAVLPPLLGVGAWSDWGYRALVLVVIACPCALVISTPVTVVSALTGAARRGILVKSGIHLEVLGKTRVVALDKTGTLTQGNPKLARVVSFEGSEHESELLVLRYAAAAESRSEHPIGRAIVEAATAADIIVPRGIEMTALPGRGAYARVEGRQVILGSPRLFRERNLLNESAKARIVEAESEGSTLVLVAWGERDSSPPTVRGAMTLTDTVRKGAGALIPALRREGVRWVVCLSGDRSTSVGTLVQAFGSEPSGFDAWRGDLLPEEKVAWISELRQAHGPVLMVGDGVNDAPALVAADIGMAMAANGTALALDTADVALMEDELDRIPEAFRLGRKAYRIIRMNIAFALAVKLVFVALGGSGFATLWMAVAVDMGSSLAVTLNGLRALKA
jgi:Cd2+/Zn2+-exporting ATPase